MQQRRTLAPRRQAERQRPGAATLQRVAAGAVQHSVGTQTGLGKVGTIGGWGDYPLVI